MLRRITSASGPSSAFVALSGVTSSLTSSLAVGCDRTATKPRTSHTLPIHPLKISMRFSNIPARQAQAHYRQDKSLSDEHMDIIHQLYQLCVRQPIDVSLIFDRLTKETIRQIQRFGTLETFVAYHHKYLKIENGKLHATQNYRSSGSNRLVDELCVLIRNNGNVSMRNTELYTNLTPKARTDFAISKLKSLTDFARLRPYIFAVNDSNGLITLTKAGLDQAEQVMPSGRDPNVTKTPSPPRSAPQRVSHREQQLADGMSQAAAASMQADETGRGIYSMGVRLTGSTTNATAPLDLLSLSWKCIPNNFFIPLARAFTEMQTLDSRVTNFGLEGFLPQLRQLPPKYLELVSFAGPNVPRNELPNHTYVRLVGTNIVMKDVETGDARCPEFEVAHRFAKDLVRYLQPHGEVGVAQLPSLLPPTLMAELPFKGPALMLIFDRMQHMFTVNKQKLSVMVTGEGGLASKELNQNTTPLPVELRVALDTLSRGPLKPQVFEELLPPNVKNSIVQEFGNLPRFVNAHKTELFLKNGLLMTPAHAAKDAIVNGATQEDFRFPHSEEELMSSEEMHLSDGTHFDEHGNEIGFNLAQQRRGLAKIIPSQPIPRMTAKQLADYIFQCLPPDRCVSWMSLRGFVDMAVFQHASFSAGDPRDFFIARPDLFVTFDPAFTNGFIIGRAHLPQPRGTWGEVKDILTVYKMIALVSVGGVSEASMLQLLPRDVRAIVKRCGGFEHLIAQAPGWFELRNPSGLPGHSVVTYIAHLNPNIKQLPSPYPTYIPCIPEEHNIRLESTTTRAAVDTSSVEPNSDVDDPYAEYEENA